MPDDKVIVATFYKFIKLNDVAGLRPELLNICEKNEIKGTILLAEEGINATVSGLRHAIDNLNQYLKKDGRFEKMEYKESVYDRNPFYRMKVKLKKEIVTFGVNKIGSEKHKANHVKPADWNALIADPDVLLLDVRNHYESEIGSFANAHIPNTKSFRDFPAYVAANLNPQKHKKIAMFCTGGIRCEKAGEYMINNGFEEVYQLQGGILRYLEEVPQNQSLWQGDCFVFDARVTVNQQLHKGDYEICYSCRNPVSKDDRSSSEYVEGVSCPECFHTLTPRRRASLIERQRQVKLAEERGQHHIGIRQQD